MQLIILGAGGYGHVIEDMAIQSEKYEDILFWMITARTSVRHFYSIKKKIQNSIRPLETMQSVWNGCAGWKRTSVVSLPLYIPLPM